MWFVGLNLDNLRAILIIKSVDHVSKKKKKKGVLTIICNTSWHCFKISKSSSLYLPSKNKLLKFC